MEDSNISAKRATYAQLPAKFVSRFPQENNSTMTCLKQIGQTSHAKTTSQPFLVLDYEISITEYTFCSLPLTRAHTFLAKGKIP